MRTRTKAIPLALLALCAAGLSQSVWALNYFDLETYPYTTEAKGEFELENSSAYTASGTQDAPAPDNNRHLFRSTVEATYGVTDKTDIAAYVDGSKLPGGGTQYDGTRFHVRHRFFEKGQLPVDLGAYAELEMPRHDVNTREVELRGIAEKDFGKWTIDLNPIVEKPIKGEETSQGWELHYAAAAIYRLNEKFHPRVDLFGDIGHLNKIDPKDQQQHLLVPGLEVRLPHHINVTAGLGFGLTPATEHRLVTLRLEKEWY